MIRICYVICDNRGRELISFHNYTTLRRRVIEISLFGHSLCLPIGKVEWHPMNLDKFLKKDKP